MFISSKDNPKIKLYRKLASCKRTRDEEGLFIIEGARSCMDFLSHGICPECIFYTQRSVERYPELFNSQGFESIPEEKRFEVSLNVAEKMSGVNSTQGVFVEARKLDSTLSLEEIRSNGRYLVTVDLSDPGNLGTMLRTSAAVGLDGVILAGDTVDLYNPKVVRSAMGSMPKLKLYIQRDAETALKTLEKGGIKTCAAVVSGGKSVRELDFSGGCAVLIGNEARGLDEKIAGLCRERVTVDMSGDVESLNAAIAATILLWEMSKA